MIKLFQKTDNVFNSNGDVIIQPLKAQITKEDNGDFFLDFVCDLKYVDLIVEDNIIVANTPQGEQAFRISNPQKNRFQISTKAYHVFYDSKNYAIADTNIVNKNCNDALAQLNSHTDNTSPFSTMSNVATVDSYRCVRKSLYDAISTVLERWGGHLVRNNFSIQILDNIGQDKGVTVRYKKNLKEISCVEDWEDVCTKILPVGRDGTLLNALNPSQSIFISSATQYEIPYTKIVEFDQDFDEEDYPTQTAYIQALVNDLRAQANAYLQKNHYPKISYTLKAHLDTITDIGDTIDVIDERLGIELMTQVIAYKYDCILDKYTEIQFGNFQKKLSDLMGTIKAETSADTKKAVQEASDKIWDTLRNSYIVFDGNQILVLDSLPKENAVNVIKIDSEGIQFSQNGINGTFTTSWSIDGIFSLGSTSNKSGILRIFDSLNGLICQMDSSGLNFYEDDDVIGQLSSDGLKFYNSSNDLIGQFSSGGIDFYNSSNDLVGQFSPDGLKIYNGENNLLGQINSSGLEFYNSSNISCQCNSGGLKVYNSSNNVVAQIDTNGIQLFADLSINNEAIKDFVVDKGTTTPWTWEKYNSGFCDIWGKVTIDSSTLSWSSFHTSLNSADASITYPFNISNAIITATMDTCGSDIGWIAQAKASSSSGGALTIVRDGNSGTMTINVHIKGNWR